METLAVTLEAPGRLALRRLALVPMGADDVAVEVVWSGVSTGTEKLLWSGRMPEFPGMGYPLVPGYEAVGRIVAAGEDATQRIGEHVFVPGSSCFQDARGLFGGSARTLIVPSSRAFPVDEALGERGVLIALAATAVHAIAAGRAMPNLIVGHGVLGRLLARIAIAYGGEPPVVWESCAERRAGARGYRVIDPAEDDRRDYRAIYDVSGDAAMLDRLIARLARRGEVVLAGFYDASLSFDFAPAFMREAHIRIAAEWDPADIKTALAMVRSGELSLDGLITDLEPAARAAEAYPRAFQDPSCLKMLLDWSDCA